jgi:hypothetical protein
MRKLLLASAGSAAVALLAGPAMASPVACATAPVATYTTLGFSCSVDGGAIVFSNFLVGTSTTGSGGVGLGNISPINTVAGEYGLQLNYLANTGSTGGGADVAWSFQVTGNYLTDAYANLNGTPAPGATATLAENLYDSNGNQITSTPSANGVNNIFISLGTTPSSATVYYGPEAFLSVTKDQQDYSSTTASSNSSIIQDEFSLTQTPLPATLPLLATGLAGLFFARRTRKKGQTGGRLESALA